MKTLLEIVNEPNLEALKKAYNENEKFVLSPEHQALKAKIAANLKNIKDNAIRKNKK